MSGVDEDPFGTEMCLANETSTQEVRASYVNPKTLDQLEEWMKVKRFLTSPMTSSVRKTSFSIELVVCQGTLMSTRRTLTS